MSNPVPTVVNVQTLVRLADQQVSQVAADFGALPIQIRESVQRQMQEANTAIVDAAAQQIVALYVAKDAFLVNLAAGIGKLKEQIAVQEKLAASVQRAVAYGNATQNFLPLSGVLGLGTGSAKSELTKIPADWVAPAAPAADAPAA